MTSSHPDVHLLLSSTSTTADSYIQMPTSASPECLPGMPAAHAQTRISPPQPPNSIDGRPIIRELPSFHPRGAKSQAYQFCFHTVPGRWLLRATLLPTWCMQSPCTGRRPAQPLLPPRLSSALKSHHATPLYQTLYRLPKVLHTGPRDPPRPPDPGCPPCSPRPLCSTHTASQSSLIPLGRLPHLRVCTAVFSA